MKKSILSIAAVVFASGVLFLTSCKKEDTTAPTITLKGDASVTIYVGETFTEPGYTATDLDGKEDESDVTSSVTVTGTVDNAKSGEYTLTYNVSDEAGNSATPVTRKVIVKHKASTITALYNVAETCSGAPSTNFTSNITGGSAATDIIISNFGNYNINISGTLGGTYNTNVTIPSQVNGSAEFSGSGTVDPDGKKVTITYTATVGSVSVTCTKTMTR